MDNEKTNIAGIGSKKAAKLPAKIKQILVMVLAIVAVIFVAVYVDNFYRNPPVRDDLEATNKLLEAGVLSDNPEVTYDTAVELHESEEVTINGKKYFMIRVTLDFDTNPRDIGPYYVAVKDGKVYTLDSATNTMIPYGV